MTKFIFVIAFPQSLMAVAAIPTIVPGVYQLSDDLELNVNHQAPKPDWCTKNASLQVSIANQKLNLDPLPPIFLTSTRTQSADSGCSLTRIYFPTDNQIIYRLIKSCGQTKKNFVTQELYSFLQSAQTSVIAISKKNWINLSNSVTSALAAGSNSTFDSFIHHKKPSSQDVCQWNHLDQTP